jgi:hypothetical protein
LSLTHGAGADNFSICAHSNERYHDNVVEVEKDEDDDFILFFYYFIFYFFSVCVISVRMVVYKSQSKKLSFLWNGHIEDIIYMQKKLNYQELQGACFL